MKATRLWTTHKQFNQACKNCVQVYFISQLKHYQVKSSTNINFVCWLIFKWKSNWLNCISLPKTLTRDHATSNIDSRFQKVCNSLWDSVTIAVKYSHRVIRPATLIILVISWVRENSWIVRHPRCACIKLKIVPWVIDYKLICMSIQIKVLSVFAPWMIWEHTMLDISLLCSR